MRLPAFASKTRTGFLSAEVAVLLVVIGVLATFGVPRFLKSVERSKVAEAFAYLAAVRSSQERYQAQHGTYARALTDLDLTMSVPKYFTASAITAGTTGSLGDSWTLALKRTGASAGYGYYTVRFTQDGYDAAHSSLQALAQINPMAP